MFSIIVAVLFVIKIYSNSVHSLPYIFVLSSFPFHEAPTVLGLKNFKHCINVSFVSVVMLSISKPT